MKKELDDNCPQLFLKLLIIIIIIIIIIIRLCTFGIFVFFVILIWIGGHKFTSFWNYSVLPSLNKVYHYYYH